MPGERAAIEGRLRPLRHGRRRHRATALTGSAILVAGAVVVGAGATAAEASPRSAAATVRAAIHQLQAARTAHFSLEGSLSGPQATTGSKRPVPITGNGQVNLATGLLELALDARSGTTIRAVETPGTAYVKVPPEYAGKVPGNKPWVSVTLQQLGQAYPQAGGLANDTPNRVLDHLAAAAATAHRVGSSTVGGVSCTEYRMQLRSTQAAVPSTSSSAQRAPATTSFPVEVWVGRGLVRRLRADVSRLPATRGAGHGSSPAPAGSGRATITLTLADIGTPVSITPPPSTQVGDLTHHVAAPPSGAA